jgi:transposase
MTRKNYLFAGADSGGIRAAAMYTLIETALCRARHNAVYADRRTMPNGSGGNPSFCVFAAHGADIARGPFGIVWLVTAPQGRRAGGRLIGSVFACQTHTA